MQVEVRVHKDLQHRWDELHAKKASMISLCEEYADWTLPHVFPRTNVEQVELQLAKDSIGAQAVNHLSNKVVSVLFPPQQLFFRLHVSTAVKQMIEQGLAAAGAPSMEAVKAELSKAILAVEEQLASTEKQAQEYMDMVAYRPQAVNTAKLLIITGNALMFHPPDKPAQVYTVRDYCVVRDLSGEVIEIMTKECKAFETFHPDIQVQLRSSHNPEKQNHKYADKDNVTIYTRIKLEDDGRFYVYQQGDHVMLDTDGAFYAKDDLPWIPLTWNLVRGEDYGRGLVADFAGAFHALNVLSGSLQNIASIMGDIKFLVNPSSLVDVGELNSSPSGSYHSGRADDVTAIQLQKQHDAQFIATMIERYEKQIAQAFLLHSQLTRQAERVTAEEIRRDADELETSNGGIYSRLASTWQKPTATIILSQIEFTGLEYGIVPQVITGMDSLSRASELDNLRMFLADLGMLNAVPEDVRMIIDMPAFAKVLGTNRGVDYQQFIKSQEQLQAEQQAMQQQQQALADQEAGREAKVAASKEAMRQQ